MERLMSEKQRISSATNKTPSSLPIMHKNSQSIFKVKPKIRIIHIFAPEIIKTDAANFRELVQRLTGKPTDDDKKPNCTKKKKARVISSKKLIEPKSLLFPPEKKKMEVKSGFDHAETELGGIFRERIKGEEEIWESANSGGGFLGGLDQFDDDGLFMQQLNNDDHHSLFMENTTTTTSTTFTHHLDASYGYGDSQIIAN